MNADGKLLKLLIKGAIAELPPEKQCEVEECAALFRNTLKVKGQAGLLAFTLVGAELSEEENSRARV